MSAETQQSCISEAHECRETLRVQNFNDKTDFGWEFPKLDQEETKNPVVVDAQWLSEYSDEIEQLRAEVDKHRELSFGNLGHSSCDEEMLDMTARCQRALNFNDFGQNDNSIKNINTEMKKHSVLCSSKLDQNHSVSSVTCNDNSWNDSGFEESLKTDDEGMKRLHQDESEAKTHASETQEQRNEPETRSITPQSEACYSLLSFASRDSGVYATDDVTEFLPEVLTERSILEELEDVFSEHELSVESCITRKSESLAATATDDAEAAVKCPIWFQKFSREEDLTIHLRSQSWGSDLSQHEAFMQSMSSDVTNDTVSSRGNTDDSVELDIEEVSENTRRRQRLTSLLTSCDRLEALSARGHSVHGGIDEVTKLVRSFSSIDDRLQALRYGLQNLSSQALKNRHDFTKLEDRASHLLTSTATSRHHMAQFYALQKLEDRLQEEWWAAYSPDSLPLHENYIV